MRHLIIFQHKLLLPVEKPGPVIDCNMPGILNHLSGLVEDSAASPDSTISCPGRRSADHTALSGSPSRYVGGYLFSSGVLN